MIHRTYFASAVIKKDQQVKWHAQVVITYVSWFKHSLKFANQARKSFETIEVFNEGDEIILTAFNRI